MNAGILHLIAASDYHSSFGVDVAAEHMLSIIMTIPEAIDAAPTVEARNERRYEALSGQSSPSFIAGQRHQLMPSPMARRNEGYRRIASAIT